MVDRNQKEVWLVSIIIPVFNRAHLIEATLDSVLGQSYPYWECLVIDDGSTDGTASVVQGYVGKDSRFRYYQRPDSHRAGGNGARNYGLTLAKGAYVQWFDSDDVMDSGLLEAQLQHLQQYQAAYSICLFDVYNADYSELVRHHEGQQLLNGVYYDFLSGRLKANLPTILFERHVLKNYRLKETLYKAQEYEFLQRFFREQNDGVLLNETLVKVRRHSDSITEAHSPKKISSALWVFLRSYLDLPREAPEAVRQHLVAQYLKYLYMSFKEGYAWVFYRYLLKMVYFSFAKGLVGLLYLGILYPLVGLGIIKMWHFKRIYGLYRP